jgi:hypothetical protein
MGFWKLGRTRRRPYGRRPQSHPWVEDACPSTPAYWVWQGVVHPAYADRVRALPMPHGGMRHLLRCQLCAAWRLYLFNPVATVFVCRRCLGLRYKSQYIGRRVDASRARLDEARVALERAEATIAQQRKKEDARRARRAASARLRRQQATWRKRRARLEHAEDAYAWREHEYEMRWIHRLTVWCERQDTRIQRLAARLEKHAVA